MSPQANEQLSRHYEREAEATRHSLANNLNELQARLTREAKVLARLEHPGIVPVHDFGLLADGRPFYVMKRVHGRTLQACIEAAAPLAERLRIFERVCEAVGFAHAHDIITAVRAAMNAAEHTS